MPALQVRVLQQNILFKRLWLGHPTFIRLSKLRFHNPSIHPCLLPHHSQNRDTQSKANTEQITSGRPCKPTLYTSPFRARHTVHISEERKGKTLSPHSLQQDLTKPQTNSSWALEPVKLSKKMGSKSPLPIPNPSTQLHRLRETSLYLSGCSQRWVWLLRPWRKQGLFHVSRGAEGHFVLDHILKSTTHADPCMQTLAVVGDLFAKLCFYAFLQFSNCFVLSWKNNLFPRLLQGKDIV